MKILIVEDSVVYQKTLKSAIEKELVFVKCDVVSSFEELKKVNKDYDLYIVDLMLHDAKGEQLDYLIKKNANIILITSYENFELQEKIKNHILDYVIKDDFSMIDYLVKFVKRLYKNPHLNILVVEDSSTMRNYQKRILQKMFFNVYEASDGEEAYKIFKEKRIDLILTDLIMPKVDGISLIKKIRQDKKMNELPIIALSSAEEKEVFLKALKIGANDFLKKPYEKEELIIRINNLLELYENYKEIKHQLLKDSLTEVYNRFYLENVLEKIFKNYEKKSIAMLDIDFFKKLNDTYGHQFGDEVLKYFANTIRSSVRKSDIVVRYGGEEFLIFLPSTSKKEAMIVVLKIMHNLKPYKNIKITFSAGIADEGETLAEMIKIADERLYKAKNEGRNRAVIE